MTGKDLTFFATDGLAAVFVLGLGLPARTFLVVVALGPAFFAAAGLDAALVAVLAAGLAAGLVAVLGLVALAAVALVADAGLEF